MQKNMKEENRHDFRWGLVYFVIDQIQGGFTLVNDHPHLWSRPDGRLRRSN